MKLITILFCLSILISAGNAAETKVPLDRLNWSQSLPLNANIILNGGTIIGQSSTTQFDTMVYQSSGEIYAIHGKNGTTIDSGTIGSAVNSRVIRSAIDATPPNGSLYIDYGTYVLNCDLNCTTSGLASYLYYWTALPVTTDIQIKGAGIGATVLQMAPAQYSTTRPALIMYDYCPYSESGGDGVGPGHLRLVLEDLTFDGDVANQTAPYYHDGAGLFLSGSERYNALIQNVEFRNSPNHALYLGYHGGGWEHNAVVSNIYTHDNWGSSQIDNTENTVLTNFLSINDGYGMWSASHYGLVLDGMLADSGHLMGNNIHIIDGSIYIFGFWKSRDDLSLRLSNVFVDSRDCGSNGIIIYDCNNVTIADGTVIAGTTADFAVSVVNSTGITLDDMELRGYRGIVAGTGYSSDIVADGCDINTTGICVALFGTGSTATLTNCLLNTSNPASYLIDLLTGTTANVIGCKGSDTGLIYTAGTLHHSGTLGMGLEAYGSASISSGDSISHGMKIKPSRVFVQSTVAGTIATAPYADITTSVFKVYFSGNTTFQSVYWHAIY